MVEEKKKGERNEERKERRKDRKGKGGKKESRIEKSGFIKEQRVTNLLLIEIVKYLS